MKICYLSSSAFADNQISLLHHFPKQYDVTYSVIFPNKNSNYTSEEISAYCSRYNISYQPFHLSYRFRDPRNLARFYQIVSMIRSGGFDLVFVANFDQLYLNTLLLLLDKRKTIIAMHDVENHSNTAFNTLTTWAKTILFRKFSNFLTYSSHQADLLRTRYANKNVFMIPLPLIGFGPMKASPKQEGFVNFLFFGNILHYKGLDILLKSIGRISSKHANFRLIIAGRSNDWQEVYEPLIVDASKISAHIGFIENDDIPGYFAEADYLVLPYRDTTQSGPLMIAYNYNVPVLASNADGFKEFFTSGQTGFSFDLDDPDDIDRVLTEAINRTNSEYLEIKQQLKARVDRDFSMQSLSAAYAKMFDQVAAGNTLKELK